MSPGREARETRVPASMTHKSGVSEPDTGLGSSCTYESRLDFLTIG
jgi:hypothetical protein